MDKDLLVSCMENREFMYRYLWRFYATYADEQFLETIIGPVAAEQTTLFFGEGAPALEIQDKLVALSQELLPLKGMDEGVDQLKSEYTRLFEGPGALPAPPWESVYASAEELMFTVRTLTIRYFYEELGYKGVNSPREADDYIGLELAFMAAVTKDIREAIVAEDVEKAKKLLEKQHEFLHDHLNFWVPKFAPRMREKAKKVGEFYLLGADLTMEFCLTDEAAVEELLAAL